MVFRGLTVSMVSMAWRPSRVYLDEGCEHFVNISSVQLRRLGDLPQCVNTTESDGGLVVAELFNRASKPLRQMPRSLLP